MVCRLRVHSKMSNNVPDKIKPFWTLRDFGAGHLGHHETFLYRHLLGPFGTLQDFVESTQLRASHFQNTI